jgi:hypothetical protein
LHRVWSTHVPLARLNAHPSQNPGRVGHPEKIRS